MSKRSRPHPHPRCQESVLHQSCQVKIYLGLEMGGGAIPSGGGGRSCRHPFTPRGGGALNRSVGGEQHKQQTGSGPTRSAGDLRIATTANGTTSAREGARGRGKSKPAPLPLPVILFVALLIEVGVLLALHQPLFPPTFTPPLAQRPPLTTGPGGWAGRNFPSSLLF